MTTDPKTAIGHNEKLAATCIGVAVLAIREMTQDEAERRRIVKQFGRNMLDAVNDPRWGANAP